MTFRFEDHAGAFVERFHIGPTGKGNLDGLTVAVKDLVDISGRQTGCGNPDWARTHDTAKKHAPVVEMLLSCGASVVGKTHTDELAYSLLGINHHFGTPLNSAAPDRIPGGSSSGSAAAVAAGYVDIGLGTDTGGSIRIPASFCGMYGLRTSHGAVSLNGVMPLAPSFDTVGWLVRELGHMHSLLVACGIDRPLTRDLQVVLAEDVWERAESAVTKSLSPFVDKVEKLWGPCRRISLSGNRLWRWREVFQICQAAEIWKCHGPWIEQVNPKFGAGVRERFERASRISSGEWSEASAEREAIRTYIADTVRHRVLLVPGAPSPALKTDSSPEERDDFRDRALEMLCPAGLAGCPQIVLPGSEVGGAPVGISLIGAPGTDLNLVELAVQMKGAVHG